MTNPIAEAVRAGCPRFGCRWPDCQPHGSGCVALAIVARHAHNAAIEAAKPYRDEVARLLAHVDRIQEADIEQANAEAEDYATAVAGFLPNLYEARDAVLTAIRALKIGDPT